MTSKGKRRRRFPSGMTSKGRFPSGMTTKGERRPLGWCSLGAKVRFVRLRAFLALVAAFGGFQEGLEEGGGGFGGVVGVWGDDGFYAPAAEDDLLGGVVFEHEDV